jgi:hypothetical protein
MYTLKNNCLECSQPLIGRSGKKYCSEMCKNAHNNKNRVVENDYIKTVNTILQRNRRILMDYSSVSRQSKVPTIALQADGFDFRFYTHCKANKSGKVVVYCYEFGYLRSDNELVQVIPDKNIVPQKGETTGISRSN